ncbi:hypothetical protein A1D31_36230 [Bradyrhizobium liaoningense]|nr:hypothetical protein A1D31_36230 [Bradyrhizobium liaoningense]
MKDFHPVITINRAVEIARARHPEDAIEDAAVVARLAASTILRKKRFDYITLEIRQAVAHDPSSDAW